MTIFTDQKELHIRPAVLLILLFLLVTACGPSQLTLKPEVRSPELSSSSNQKQLEKIQQKLNAAELDKKLPEMTATEHERLADSLMQRGDLQTAYLHYDKALGLEPGKLDLEYKKGLTLLKAANYKEAVNQFKIVLEQNPVHAPAHEGMGRVLLAEGKLEKAQSHFLTAVSLNKKLWLSYNCLGAIYDRSKKWPEAVGAYKNAIKLQPAQGRIYNNLGMSYLLTGQYYQAVWAFKEAMRKGFVSGKVHNNLGVALARLKKYEAAFNAFKKAGGEPEAYNNLGCCYMEAGQYQKAMACFEKAITLKPTYYTTAGENLKRIQAKGTHMAPKQK